MKNIIILLIISILFVQCGQRPGSGKKISDVPIDTTYSDTFLNVTYLMLSPNEIMDEILNEKRELNPAFVNTLSNAVKYVNAKQLALNLGVYITDFGYLNLSNNKSNVIDYFRIIRDLAQKNNIMGCFDENIFNRIQENLANNDSLLRISQDMYYNMIDILESAKRQKVFALVSSGALIESLYLSVMNVSSFKEYHAIAQKVFDQGKLLDNFYGLLSSYKHDPDIRVVMDELDSLKKVLNQADIKKSAKKIIKNSNNHFEVKGGDNVIVNENAFNSFKQCVIKTRGDIIESIIK